MTPTGDNNRVFIDTNILVYSNLANSPLHNEALRQLTGLRNQGLELWISRQIIREYLVTMTRSSRLNITINPADLNKLANFATLQLPWLDLAHVDSFSSYRYNQEKAVKLLGLTVCCKFLKRVAG